MIRTFRELVRIPTFEERFRYLALHGSVGRATFGHERWMNQTFYASRQWKQLRQSIILRDEGCDLAAPGFEIHDRIIIHHMNPMESDDIEHGNPDILDPEFLISTTHQTHNAIHYGDESLLPRPMIIRRPRDTRLW
jgi:hypothetical protein